MEEKKPSVLVVMGSDSDYDIVKDCLKVLKQFGIEFEAVVCSAHRTPDAAAEYAKNAADNGFEVVIAAAGKAAHLPGVLAAYTTLPVIGLPIKSSTLDGLDSLLSIVQMPNGVPVATVAINGAENAGLLAAQILGLKYTNISDKLVSYKESMKNKVMAKNVDLQKKINEA
ncbi:MAG TPA: 5-(carboxyamino)imidazole ribonucleotide mutase [Clostridiales bacterium]|nr:5-(carboxyamino)imidazole ribonucleotide mutase [Clostridiales bacterium]